MGVVAFRDTSYVPAPVPKAGFAVDVTVTSLGLIVLLLCFYRRVSGLARWSKIPLARWLILMIYVDSFMFILASTILNHGWGFSTSLVHCTAAILLCLVCYMSTKLIYYFMVEKVYIIRSVRTPRMKSKLYLFNCFGMLVPYVVVMVLNFVYHISRINQDGKCVIGMERQVLIPLVVFDIGANVWLTLLFLMPLRKLYSYTNDRSSTARTVALRTFIGAAIMLLSVIANLGTLAILDGEEGWVCIMSCNVEILFSALVLHWITTKESSTPENSQSGPSNHRPAGITQSVRGTRLDDDHVFNDAKTTTRVVGNYKPSYNEEEGAMELQRVTSGGGKDIVVTKATEIHVSAMDVDEVSAGKGSWTEEGVQRIRGSGSQEELVEGRNRKM